MYIPGYNYYSNQYGTYTVPYYYPVPSFPTGPVNQVFVNNGTVIYPSPYPYGGPIHLFMPNYSVFMPFTPDAWDREPTHLPNGLAINKLGYYAYPALFANARGGLFPGACVAMSFCPSGPFVSA